MSRRRRLWLVPTAAAGLVALLAAVWIFSVWRSIRTGDLLEPAALAGPATVCLFSFTASPDDPGVTASLARLSEMEGRRTSSRLPSWARWLLAGGTTEAPSAQAAAVMPVRFIGWVDHDPAEGTWGGMVVSLSTWSERIEQALGADGRIRHRGVALAPPAQGGEPWTALVGNNIALASDERDLGRIVDRLLEEPRATGTPMESALRSLPPDGDGLIVFVDAGHGLETLLLEGASGYGIDAAEFPLPGRVLPRGLLSSVMSIDLVDADRASLEGEMRFIDPSSAEEAEPLVGRALPRALAILGFESDLRLRREGDALVVTGGIGDLDVLWDRILAGRLLPAMPRSQRP